MTERICWFNKGLRKLSRVELVNIIGVPDTIKGVDFMWTCLFRNSTQWEY